MNIESKITPFVALTLSASLLAGCTSEQTFTKPDTTSQKSDLLFETAPEADFSISNCNLQPNSWAVHIDTDPTNINDHDQTIGFTEGYTEDGRANAVSGAKIRSLGGLAYEIATSDDDAGDTTKVDLGVEPFSIVLDGGDGYDISLSARLGGDGAAYFQLNCLPDFDSSYVEETPLEVVPIIPALPPAVEA